MKRHNFKKRENQKWLSLDPDIGIYWKDFVHGALNRNAEDTTKTAPIPLILLLKPVLLLLEEGWMDRRID